MTTDVDGKRAFVMTLRAREQDIRREKAASNICTNQALCALRCDDLRRGHGPHGLRDVAALGAARAAELEAALAAAGAPRLTRVPTSTSFAVRVPNAAAVHARLLGRGILAGLPLARAIPDDPALADALLVCATEVTTADEIAAFAAALGEELAEAPDDRRRRPPRATIFERSRPAARRQGAAPPKDALARIPAGQLRAAGPRLPEVSEPELTRHYVNLSQLN